MSRQSAARPHLLVLVLLMIAAGQTAQAADKFWDGGAAPAGLDGIFSDSANWDSFLPPRVNDVAHFGTSVGNVFQNAYTVTFTTDPTNQRLVVEDDAVTFDLNGHIYTMAGLDSITLGVASPFTFFAGSLTITDGTIAVSSNSALRIGTSRAGFLTVTTGGLLAGSDMGIQVGGSGSSGTLTVNGGGDIIAQAISIHDNGGSSDATATITGNGSALFATDIRVGTLGNGTLNITAGGDVESNSGFIGDAAFDIGRVAVDGVGSRWINSGKLTVGGDGIGILNITGGGRVSSGNSVIGSTVFDESSLGSVVVEGVGSTWAVSGRLGVGADPASGGVGGDGGLFIRSGSFVNVVQDTFIFSNDLLRLDGGTLSTTEISFPISEISITPGTFDWDSGTLHVGRFHGDLTVPDAGVFAPGISSGDSIVFGDYTETPGAKLQIEIGGSPSSFQFDVLQVRGDAVLSGDLELSLVNGFVPTATNAYSILTPTVSLSGQFDNVASGQRLKTSDGLGSFVVNYGAGSPFNPTFVVLSAFQPLLPGDYNFDNLVDAADYVFWRDTRGQTGVALPGDGNSDGAVDTADYNFWRARFGQMAGMGGASPKSAVPEPASLVLLCLSAVALVNLRRKSFSSHLLARCPCQ